jgi:type IV pilus assembly protein PilO
MALLPEDQRDQYRLLGVIIVLAIGAAFYLYMYRPRTVELEEIAQRVEEIEFQNEVAEARMADLEGMQRELELGERQYAVLQRLVPSRGEVPAIYEAIASESQSLGLDFISVVPAVPVPDTTGYFLRQNWELELEGEYHDVGRLLSRVASFERIVRPSVETIMPSRSTNAGRQLVRAKFDLETYVIPPGGGVEGGGQ